MLQFNCRQCGAANFVAKKSLTPQNSTFSCRSCGTRNQLSVVSAPQPPAANAIVPVPPPAPSAPPAFRANIRSNVPVPPISPVIVPTPSQRRKSGLGLALCLTFLALIVVGAGGAALWFAFGASTFLSPSSSGSDPFAEFVDPKTKALARFYADVEAAEQAYAVNLDFQRLLIPDNVSADNLAAYIKQYNQTAVDANNLSQALYQIDLNSPQYAAVPRDVKTSFATYRSSMQELAQFLNANVITQEELDKATKNVAATALIGGLAGFLFDSAFSPQDEYVYDEVDDSYYVVRHEPSIVGTELGAQLGLSAGLETVRSQFNALVSQKAEPLAQACVAKWNEFYLLCETF